MTSPTAVPLSVLDLAWRQHGQTNGDAVRTSVALAAEAERLEYRRYWFAAHHGLPVSTAAEAAALARHHHRQAIGTPDVVREALRSLIASTGTGEVMVQLVASTSAGRRRSLQIAADALA